jgi:cell division protein FtsZ
MLPGMDAVPSTPRPPVRPAKKSTPKPKQEVLPLDVASRGRFERSEPTIEEGEDLDIPTFIRLKIRLK